MDNTIIRKLLATMIMTLSFSLVACGSSEDSEKASDNPEEVLEEVSDEEVDEETSDEATEEVDEEIEEVAEIESDDETTDYSDKPVLEFDTVNIYGNQVTSEDFSEAKLIMLNFWEPWCGPGVGEMPELEMLYEEYKDDGFVIIGAFSTEGMDEEVLSVMADTGVKYPIIYASEEMYNYMTDYVPTTIFLDGEGHVLSDEPYIGANSYENWDEIIKSYL